jgi:hypothetical protein
VSVQFHRNTPCFHVIDCAHLGMDTLSAQFFTQHVPDPIVPDASHEGDAASKVCQPGSRVRGRPT